MKEILNAIEEIQAQRKIWRHSDPCCLKTSKYVTLSRDESAFTHCACTSAEM